VRGKGWSAALGIWGLVLIAGLAVVAPVLAPNPFERQFTDRAYAPPMRVHVRDATGFRAPFVYRQVLDDRLTRLFRDDTSRPVPLSWGGAGRLVSIDPDAGPLLLLGADALGRDVWSRLLYGARLSLGVTFVGALGALVLGAIAGGLAGATGGRADMLLMLVADFVLVLPGAYLVLVLRATLPQTLSATEVFWIMAVLFAVAGWPHVARGVRAIVATERHRDYVEAARAAGAGPIRLLRHLLPATRGFLGVELVLLVPALLVAEATISFLGLGFSEPVPSWGAMLQEASNINGMRDAPWILAPALALFLVVLGVQLAGGRRTTSTLLRPGEPALAGAARQSRKDPACVN
jgi:peptide/nickel transport system permease protein